jgi:hypothetical protein
VRALGADGDAGLLEHLADDAVFEALVARPPYDLFVLVLVYTGLRFGESLGYDDGSSTRSRIG